MKESEPDPVQIATLAATFIPPLNLPENWRIITPEALREILVREFEPGLAFTGDPETEYYNYVETLQAGGSTGPSLFEVLAAAAVRRARLLIDLASGNVSIEGYCHSISTDPKQAGAEEADPKQAGAEETDSNQAGAEETDPKQAAAKKTVPKHAAAKETDANTEFNKHFGYNKRAGFTAAATLVLGGMSDRNLNCLLDHWLKLPESDLSRRGLDLNPHAVLKGVTWIDYPDFKRNLLLLKKLDYDKLLKRLQREAGAKGGRISQGKKKRESKKIRDSFEGK